MFTFIPNNSSSEGSFTKAMLELDLRTDVKENEGRDQHAWDRFMLDSGKWGAMLTKIGVAVMIFLVVLSLVVCCVILVIRSPITKTVASQMAVLDKLILTEYSVFST